MFPKTWQFPISDFLLAKIVDVARLERRIIVVECLFIAMLIICHSVALSYVERVAEPPSASGAIMFLLFCLALSLLPKSGLSRLQTLALVCLELLLATIASVLGLQRLFTVLYLVIIARSGLRLSRNDFAFVIAICVFLFIIGKEARYFLTEKAIFALSFGNHIFHLLILGRIGNFIIAVLFAAMCVSALKGERQSRIERERLNLEVVNLSQKLERTRLAREIHDNVGHTLTSLNMQMELAQKLLVKAPEKTSAALRRVRELAESARQDLRASVKAHEEAEINLESRLEFLVNDCNQINDFTTILQFNAPEPEAKVQHEVFSIVKEALNNVKKYANANSATVSIAAVERDLIVSVEDDGIGFDTKEQKKSKFGIQGMRERAQLIGGTVEIHSSQQGGTKVSLRVPLAIAEPANTSTLNIHVNSEPNSAASESVETEKLESETLELMSDDQSK